MRHPHVLHTALGIPCRARRELQERCGRLASRLPCRLATASSSGAGFPGSSAGGPILERGDQQQQMEHPASAPAALHGLCPAGSTSSSTLSMGVDSGGGPPAARAPSRVILPRRSGHRGAAGAPPAPVANPFEAARAPGPAPVQAVPEEAVFETEEVVTPGGTRHEVLVIVPSAEGDCTLEEPGWSVAAADVPAAGQEQQQQLLPEQGEGAVEGGGQLRAYALAEEGLQHSGASSSSSSSSGGSAADVLGGASSSGSSGAVSSSFLRPGGSALRDRSHSGATEDPLPLVPPDGAPCDAAPNPFAAARAGDAPGSDPILDLLRARGSGAGAREDEPLTSAALRRVGEHSGAPDQAPGAPRQASTQSSTSYVSPFYSVPIEESPFSECDLLAASMPSGLSSVLPSSGVSTLYTATPPSTLFTGTPPNGVSGARSHGDATPRGSGRERRGSLDRSPSWKGDVTPRSGGRERRGSLDRAAVSKGDVVHHKPRPSSLDRALSPKGNSLVACPAVPPLQVRASVSKGFCTR